MEMTEHTPGPWAVSEKGITVLGELVYGIYAPDIKGRQGIFLGSVGTQPPDVVKANAQLIAAAPDLLEALEAVEDAIKWDAAMGKSISARKMKLARIPIYERWAKQIEGLGYKHFNDSKQLLQLADRLRSAAIAKATPVEKPESTKI